MRQVVSATEMTPSISIHYMHNITVGQHTPFLSIYSCGIIIAHNNAQLKVKGDYITY